MKLAIIVAATLFGVAAHGQSIDGVLAVAQANSPAMERLRREASAQKFANRSGITLANPEVEFGHLWGMPSSVGVRNDLSVMQAFDLSTIFGVKRRLATAQNQAVDMQLAVQRSSLLLQIKELCYDMVYLNALVGENGRRLADAKSLSEAYDKMLERGSANILEVNKARLALVSAQSQSEQSEADRVATQRLLDALCGERVTLDDARFELAPLPADFQAWFSQAQAASPVLAQATAMESAAQRGISSARSASLPTISAGYMREKVVGEGYQGIKVGISLPLWENKNRVKQAKAEALAASSRTVEATANLYAEMAGLYARSAALRSSALRYGAASPLHGAPVQLRQAFDAGRLSLIEYLNELTYYYAARNESLIIERDYAKSIARLEAFKL